MNLDAPAAKIIRYTLYALFFIVPLIFLPGNVELFQFNKMMVVYLATTIITAAWLVRMIAQGRFFVRRTPLDLPLLLFLLSQLISTIFSIEPHTSLFGYYSRFHGGLFSTLSYILLFYALVSNMTRKEITNSLLSLLASTTIVSLYGILEHFGIDANYWVQDVRNRVFSTLGQPNWLAALLVTITPFSLYFIVKKEQIKLRKPTAEVTAFMSTLLYVLRLLRRKPLQAPTPYQFYERQKRLLHSPLEPIQLPVLPISKLAPFLTGIFYLTLLYTKSRSGLLGFAVMYVTFWGLLWLSAKGKAQKISMEKQILPGTLSSQPSALRDFIKTSILIIAITLLVGSPFTPNVSQILRGYTTRTPSASAVTSPTTPPRPEGGTESGEIRRIVWKGAIRVWHHWPLFGSGVETFAYSYYNFRPLEHNFVSEWDFLYNKAHNEYLNYLATTGAFGLATYLLLMATYIIWSLKQIVKNKTLLSSHYSLLIAHYSLPIALLAGYVGVSVTNFFGFSTVSDGLLFFLYPAIAISVVQEKPRWLTLGKKEKDKRLSGHQWLLIVALLSLSLFISMKVGVSWYADRIFAKGKTLSDANQISQGLLLVQQAVKLVPDEPIFRDRLALDLARSASALAQNGEATTAAQFAQLATLHSDIVLLQNPVHLNFLKNRAATMLHLATIDPKYRKIAAQALARAEELAPTDPKLPYNLGLLFAQEGQQEQAIEAMQKSVNLKPDYEPARLALASTFEEKGQLEDAIAQYQAILEYFPNNPTATAALKRIATESGKIK